MWTGCERRSGRFGRGRAPRGHGGAAAIGKELEALEKPKAKARQREHGDTAPGKSKNTSGKLPEVSTGRARDRVASAVGMSGKTYEKAKKVVEAAEANRPEHHT